MPHTAVWDKCESTTADRNISRPKILISLALSWRVPVCF